MLLIKRQKSGVQSEAGRFEKIELVLGGDYPPGRYGFLVSCKEGHTIPDE